MIAALSPSVQTIGARKLFCSTYYFLTKKIDAGNIIFRFEPCEHGFNDS